MSDVKWWPKGIGYLLIGAVLLLTVLASIFVSIGIRATADGCLAAPCIEQRDLLMQANMAMAAWATSFVTAVAAVVSGLGLYLIYGTLKAAQRSAVAAEETVSETRRVGEAQVRAYLIVTGAHLQIHRGGEEVQVFYSFRNSGQTPAKRVFCDVATHIDVFGDKGWEAAAVIASDYAVRSDLASQGDHSGYTDPRAPAAVEGRPHPHIWNQNARVVVRLTLGYVDVFGNKHLEPVHYGGTIDVKPMGTTRQVSLNRQLRDDGKLDFDVFD